MAKTLIGTARTNANGVATTTYEPTSVGDINIIAECESSNGTLESNIVNVNVNISNMAMELGVTGSSFSTYSSTPFTYNDKVFVDWGDNSGIVEYTGGKLTHSYSSNDNYTVKVYGDITILENSCFRDCTGLTSIIIPDSVISIGANCFYNCSDLTSISIPNSVTSIGAYCFRDCTDLTSIIIPDSVINIGDSCFNSCSGLTSISIPNSVTSIGNSCFFRCSGLTSISIPNSVTSIGNSCFGYCTSLTSIILNWDTSNEIITYNQNWITNASSNLLFYIPNDVTSLYTAKEYPSNKLIEIYDEIELTADKSILSYADNETCTLTVQLLKESSPFMIGGVTVEFFNGTTSIGTAQTNSNGVATITYSSTGNGDVMFSATDNNITSEDILIEDCLYYSSPASTNAIIVPWTDNCIAEYEVYPSDYWNWHYLVVFQEENQENIATLSTSYDNNSSAPIKTTNFPAQNTWTPMQFKTENGIATVSSNGTVKGTTNISLSDLTSIKIYNSKSNTQQRNIKIKPLQIIVNQELIETNAQSVAQVNSQLSVFRITLTLNNISDNQNIYCSINGESETMTKNNNSLMYAGAFPYTTTYFDVILRIDPYIDENNNYWNGLNWEGTIEVT